MLIKRNVMLAAGWLLMLAVVVMPGRVFAQGSVFVSGHDAIWHSNFGSNAAGAANVALTGIEFARNGSTDKFLFIESKTTAVPSGNARVAPFLTSALGFTAGTDFDVMDGADLLALGDFAATLSGYSAIVVASDHGGMLTAAELGFLNSHSSDIIDYVNGGGGIAAFAQSNEKGLIGTETRFGFLPFLVSSSDFGEFESGNTVTTFGGSLGLVDSDVNGNFSHNFFTTTGGMTPVDLRNGREDQPLTLAFRGVIDDGGTVAVPVPAALPAGLALMGLMGLRRKKLA